MNNKNNEKERYAIVASAIFTLWVLTLALTESQIVTNVLLSQNSFMAIALSTRGDKNLVVVKGNDGTKSGLTYTS